MKTATDPFNLSRFVEAQAGIYDTALSELHAGEKRSHWMWFIFPQIAGLGLSAMAQKYAVQSREEALAYVAHPVLGPRLAECAAALMAVEGRSAEQIMGHPDYIKLCSCMTLFAQVSDPGSVYEQVLEKYYAGTADTKTTEILLAK